MVCEKLSNSSRNVKEIRGLDPYLKIFRLFLFEPVPKVYLYKLFLKKNDILFPWSRSAISFPVRQG